MLGHSKQLKTRMQCCSVLPSGMGKPGRPIPRIDSGHPAHALVLLCSVLQAVFDPRALVLHAKLRTVLLQMGLLILQEVLVFPTPGIAKQLCRDMSLFRRPLPAPDVPSSSSSSSSLMPMSHHDHCMALDYGLWRVSGLREPSDRA